MAEAVSLREVCVLVVLNNDCRSRVGDTTCMPLFSPGRESVKRFICICPVLVCQRNIVGRWMVKSVTDRHGRSTSPDITGRAMSALTTHSTSTRTNKSAV